MRASYDGVVLDCLDLEDWVHEAVMDPSGTDFICWHHDFVGTFLVNPDATGAGHFPPLSYAGAGGALDVRAGHIAPGAPQQVLAAGAAKLGTFRRTGEGGFKPRTDLTTMELGLGPDVSQFGAFKDQGKVQVPPGEARPGAGGVPPGADKPFGGAGQPGANKPGKPPAGLGQDVLEVSELVGDPALDISGGRSTVPWTHQEIRERFRRPRRQLLVWTYSGPTGGPEFLLVSPHPGAGTDARHGPIVTVLDVPKVLGNSSMIMRLRVETWEAPALEFANANTATFLQDFAPVASGSSVLSSRILPPFDARMKSRRAWEDVDAKRPDNQFAGKGGDRGWNVVPGQVKLAGLTSEKVLATPALISNRWKMTFRPNPETYLMDQVIEGTAVFRLDVLQMRGLTCDQLRAQLWHPIPAGYIRQPPKVSLSELGDAVAYEIVDQQQLMNFPSGAERGVIRVSVQQGVEYSGYDQVGGG